MLKFFFAVLFSTGICASDFQVRFESSEHSLAGDQVVLHLGSKILHLQNSLALSFGDMIAMPDYYGVVGSPISQGQSKEERQARFIAAFNTLANKQDSVSESTQIIDVIHEERDSDEIADEQNKKFNCITGGACSGTTWWLTPGRYLLLAEQDYDHFGDNAILVYRAGHEVALQKATEGNLEQAYALEAFADHFLTDRFSSGHIRVPRVELPREVTPSVVGSLLVKFMHDEESTHGLHVHNAKGDHWVAYGDHSYLDPANKDNLNRMQKALQISADEVYAAFLNKNAATKQEAVLLIPQADEDALSVKQDIAPLFYWDTSTNQLMRRSNLSDPFDAQWTGNWKGWSTLALLKAMGS